MKKKAKAKLKNLLVYLIIAAAASFATLLLVSCIWINYSVEEKCSIAQSRYEGDCTTALISLLEDEENPFRERNSAIWALGQLGDPKALPVLTSLYTGDILNREPINETISQYELKKAIALAEGGFNLTSITRKLNPLLNKK